MEVTDGGGYYYFGAGYFTAVQLELDIVKMYSWSWILYSCTVQLQLDIVLLYSTFEAGYCTAVQHTVGAGYCTAVQHTDEAGYCTAVQLELDIVQLYSWR